MVGNHPLSQISKLSDPSLAELCGTFELLYASPLSILALSFTRYGELRSSNGQLPWLCGLHA